MEWHIGAAARFSCARLLVHRRACTRYSRSSNGDGDCRRPASPEQPAERPASAEQSAQCSDELPASLMKCIRDSKEYVVSTLSQRGV